MEAGSNSCARSAATVGTAADGELFTACDVCRYPVCRPCYEYERKEGTQACPQCKTKYRRHKGSAPARGDECEDVDVDDATYGNQDQKHRIPEKMLTWRTSDDVRHANKFDSGEIGLSKYDSGEIPNDYIPSFTHSQVSGEIPGAFPGHMMSPAGNAANPSREFSGSLCNVAWKERVDGWKMKDKGAVPMTNETSISPSEGHGNDDIDACTDYNMEDPLMYDRDGELSQLAVVDIFVITVDPMKEPPLVTANTVLSILAVDYLVDKMARLRLGTMLGTILEWFGFTFVMVETLILTAISFLIWFMCHEIWRLVRMVMVFLGHGGGLDSNGDDVPRLVYVSREKCPGSHHDKKAGAMNALVRVSAVLTTPWQYIMNLDSDHYINNNKALREIMCFLMDPNLGRNVYYVQFPHRFDGIDTNDRYTSMNTVFFDINLRVLDGTQGPVYMGTGCVVNRTALYGYEPSIKD